MPQEPASLIHHSVLQACGNAIVEALDPRPQLAHVEDLARGGVGARDVRRVRARFFLRARDERRAHAIDEAVRRRGRDDLALQAVPRNCAREALLDGRREVAPELGREIRILRHIGGEQVIAEPDLAVGEHHRQLRPREAEPALAPLIQLFIERQVL